MSFSRCPSDVIISLTKGAAWWYCRALFRMLLKIEQNKTCKKRVLREVIFVLSRTIGREDCKENKHYSGENSIEMRGLNLRNYINPLHLVAPKRFARWKIHRRPRKYAHAIPTVLNTALVKICERINRRIYREDWGELRESREGQVKRVRLNANKQVSQQLINTRYHPCLVTNRSQKSHRLEEQLARESVLATCIVPPSNLIRYEWVGHAPLYLTRSWFTTREDSRCKREGREREERERERER